MSEQPRIKLWQKLKTLSNKQTWRILQGSSICLILLIHLESTLILWLNIIILSSSNCCIKTIHFFLDRHRLCNCKHIRTLQRIARSFSNITAPNKMSSKQAYALSTLQRISSIICQNVLEALTRPKGITVHWQVSLQQINTVLSILSSAIETWWQSANRSSKMNYLHSWNCSSISLILGSKQFAYLVIVFSFQ